MSKITLNQYGILVILSTIVGGIAMSTPVIAAQSKGGMHHSEMHGKGHHGHSWKSTLTEKQQAELDKLRLAHAKVKLPLKAKMKAIKVDLALLVTADKPDYKDINQKISELVKLKQEKLQEKYKYYAAKRKVLTPEQRVSYDLYVLKSAMHKRKGKGHHRHH